MEEILKIQLLNSKMASGDSGKLVKVEKDFSETVDKELPICQELAKVRIIDFLINATFLRQLVLPL